MKNYFYSKNKDLIDESIKKEEKLLDVTKNLILKLEKEYCKEEKKYYWDFIEKISFNKKYYFSITKNINNVIKDKIVEIIFSQINDLDIYINEEERSVF